MGAPISKRKGHVVGLVAAAIVSASVTVPAHADQYSDQIMGEDHVSGGAIILDALVARPALLAGTVAGSVLFVGTLPFSLAGGNVEKTWGVLVVTPAENTFVRCLGCTPVQHERARADRQTELANAPQN